MSSLHLLISLLVTLPVLSTSLPTNTPSVYEVLQQYNFSVGLLPVGITRYELDTNTGKFKVYLNKTCEFYVQDYQLKYKSTISGTISKNELKDLSGISVKVLLFWLNIGEVGRDGDVLEFSVGIVSADFEVGNFEESPQCGCGFDCNGGVGSDKRDGKGYATKVAMHGAASVQSPDQGSLAFLGESVSLPKECPAGSIELAPCVSQKDCYRNINQNITVQEQSTGNERSMSIGICLLFRS
ncbi:Epoxide hydrolase family protein [Heracleum sosnowskyi]|uniref:Epoxide hydrolase family protein n=1 Tax=Heracleum sosnowskyi TaxID=360622 RepID=A0AAD8M2A4_9APIA|nr:Epoxide hydrolase family protein [Heracleum sosnowskyi]